MEIPFEVKPRPDTGLWNAKIGIWLFLASEVMLFGGLFSGYLFLRLGSSGEPDYFWPQNVLNVWFGFANTLILILSSIFVVIAWLQLKLRDYRKFQIWMGLVVLCAVIFLVNKGFEYTAKFNHYGIKLSDNSIIEGHGIDDTIRYEGIKEVNVDIARFNGQFLTKIVGDTPTFREKLPVNPEGEEAFGDPITLSIEEIKKIEERINEKLKEKHAESNDQKTKEDSSFVPLRWLPAMGVKQLTFVADKEFAIEIRRSKLRKSFPDSAKFRDQTLLKGKVSAQTPGLSLHAVDRIDLRATDSKDPEKSSLVWKYLGEELHHGSGHDAHGHKEGHGEHDSEEEDQKAKDEGQTAKEQADTAKEIFLSRRQSVIDEAKEKGVEPDLSEALNHSIKKWKDEDEKVWKSHPPIVIPWEHVKLYSNFTPKWNTYYAIYFTLTGLHGLHVLIGAIVLAYFGLFGRKLYDKNPEHMTNRVEVGGLFWHFVDLVWIFLFPILYLM